MTEPQLPRTFRLWAIEITGSPLNDHRRFYQSDQDRPLPIIFRTRAEARTWLETFRARNAWTIKGRWASEGGSRIYRSVRVVPVRVTIEPRQP